MREDVDTELDFRENKSFARAIDALKFARQALAQMDKSLRQALFWPVERAEQGIDDFLTAFGELEPKRPIRRGRPPGTVKHPASHKFVFQLLDCASYGGNLSFEKFAGKGTLNKALNKLVPYLPDGLDPHKLPLTTLQRIKICAAKAVRQITIRRTRYWVISGRDPTEISSVILSSLLARTRARSPEYSRLNDGENDDENHS